MKHNYKYPDNTSGSKMAAKVRAEANRMKEAERAKMLAEGMALIYGQNILKKTVKSP